MKCSYHPEVDATCACTNCGKLVCNECAVDAGGKKVCKPCAGQLMSAARNAPPPPQYQPVPQYQPAQPVHVNVNNVNTNMNTNVNRGRVRRKYSFFWDVVLTLCTGGLWLIWVILRPKYY